MTTSHRNHMSQSALGGLVPVELQQADRATLGLVCLPSTPVRKPDSAVGSL